MLLTDHHLHIYKLYQFTRTQLVNQIALISSSFFRKPAIMGQDEIQAPLVAQVVDHKKHQSNKPSNFMVYLTTFVAVCGSFAFGSCVSSKSGQYMLIILIITDLVLTFILITTLRFFFSLLKYILQLLSWLLLMFCLLGGLLVAYSIVHHKRSESVTCRGSCQFQPKMVMI